MCGILNSFRKDYMCFISIYKISLVTCFRRQRFHFCLTRRWALKPLLFYLIGKRLKGIQLSTFWLYWCPFINIFATFLNLSNTDAMSTDFRSVIPRLNFKASTEFLTKKKLVAYQIHFKKNHNEPRKNIFF